MPTRWTRSLTSPDRLAAVLSEIEAIGEAATARRMAHIEAVGPEWVCPWDDAYLTKDERHRLSELHLERVRLSWHGGKRRTEA